MNIAIIPRLSKEISPTAVSGVSVFTFTLASQLANMPEIEHIDVYGIGDNYFSSEKITYVSLVPDQIEHMWINDAILSQYTGLENKHDNLLHLNLKLIRTLSQKKYDLIHDNSCTSLYYSLAPLFGYPVLTTLHTSPFTPELLLSSHLQLTDSPHAYTVTLSQRQTELLTKIGLKSSVIDTIPNGIDIDQFPYVESTTPHSYALWLGRIEPSDNKGYREAIEVTNITHTDLHLVGVATQSDSPSISNAPHVSFIDGHLTPEAKANQYGNAAFLLYPLTWEEPFGLIFLESMATGTPVISFARGAAPEIITDGVTGFLVNPSPTEIRGDYIIKKTGIQGLCEAVEKVKNLPANTYAAMRKACRDKVMSNFTSQQMADRYMQAYKKVIMIDKQYR